MTCKDCLHYDICVFHLKGNENEKCLHFKNKADLVEVVRCKDCEHWIYWADEKRCSCDLHYKHPNREDFCSYGDRKGE